MGKRSSVEVGDLSVEVVDLAVEVVDLTCDGGSNEKCDGGSNEKSIPWIAKLPKRARGSFEIQQLKAQAKSEIRSLINLVQWSERCNDLFGQAMP